MARTSTQKMPYWQFDVGLFNDLKIVDLNDRYGPLGETIFFRILSYISDSGGYFAQINDALILSIYRSVGSKWIKDRKVVSEVIHYCGVCGLFDVNLLTQNVITSPSIQRRWLYAKIKSRSKYSTARYWLIGDGENEDEPVHGAPYSDENKCNRKGDNCSKNSDNCSKNSVYKGKGNEGNLERKTKTVSLSQQKFHECFPDKAMDGEISEEYDIDKLIAEINKSSFLTGSNNLGLAWCVKNATKILSGQYADHKRKVQSKPQNFEQREYSVEELNGYFSNED